MATAKLPLPDDRRGQAFRKLVEVLKAGTLVRRLNPVWQTPDDGVAADDPAATGRVWIGLFPECLPSEVYCSLGGGRRSMKSPVLVTVAVRIPGYFWENAAAVWGAIEDPLFGRSLQPLDRRALDLAMRAEGIACLEVLQPAVPAGPDEPAEGQLLITVYRDC